MYVRSRTARCATGKPLTTPPSSLLPPSTVARPRRHSPLSADLPAASVRAMRDTRAACARHVVCVGRGRALRAVCVTGRAHRKIAPSLPRHIHRHTQVLGRWCVQHGYIYIPKSVRCFPPPLSPPPAPCRRSLLHRCLLHPAAPLPDTPHVLRRSSASGWLILNRKRRPRSSWFLAVTV